MHQGVHRNLTRWQRIVYSRKKWVMSRGHRSLARPHLLVPLSLSGLLSDRRRPGSCPSETGITIETRPVAGSAIRAPSGRRHHGSRPEATGPRWMIHVSARFGSMAAANPKSRRRAISITAAPIRSIDMPWPAEDRGPAAMDVAIPSWPDGTFELILTNALIEFRKLSMSSPVADGRYR